MMPRIAARSCACALAAAALLLLAVCCGVQGHGGPLHRYTFNQNVLKYVPTASIDTDLHATVATCNTWAPLNLAAMTPTLFTLPWTPAQLNMTISGYIDVISYMASNCSDSPTGGLSPLLRFSVWIRQGDSWVSRPPPSGLMTFAFGFTGTCDAPGNLYRNNVTLQDSHLNLAWWGGEYNVIGLGMNDTDTYPGYVWGTSVNPWLYRNSTDPNRLRSIVVFAQAGPTFCCNVNYTGYPAPGAILARAKNCSAGDDDMV